MIIDKLEKLRQYEGTFSKFKPVFDYLFSIDIKNIPEGKHQMPDDIGFISIDKVMLRPKEGAFLESHKNYIDIQIPFNVVDTMGWRSVSECRSVKTPYNEEKDIIFYSDEPDFYIPVSPDWFIVFFPGDAHTPIIGSGMIHKAVIKVKI